MQKAGRHRSYQLCQPTISIGLALPGQWLLGRSSQSKKSSSVHFNTKSLDHGPCLRRPSKEASRETLWFFFLVVDHSKERHFHPKPQFSHESRTKKGL